MILSREQEPQKIIVLPAEPTYEDIYNFIMHMNEEDLKKEIDEILINKILPAKRIARLILMKYIGRRAVIHFDILGLTIRVAKLLVKYNYPVIKRSANNCLYTHPDHYSYVKKKLGFKKAKWSR